VLERCSLGHASVGVLESHLPCAASTVVHRPSSSAVSCSVAPVATPRAVVMEGKKPWRGSVRERGMENVRRAFIQDSLHIYGGKMVEMVWDFLGQIKTLMKRLSPKHTKSGARVNAFRANYLTDPESQPSCVHMTF